MQGLGRWTKSVRIVECELVRLETPFRRHFKHAAAARSRSDAIIIQIVTENGIYGFGEIQARPYVTGENNDDIWRSLAPEIAESLIGSVIGRYEDVYERLGAASAYQAQPALVGGFDIAILDALNLEGGFCWTDVFGPKRQGLSTKCLTIGEDYSGEDLRTQARLARLGGYAVVKLKVGGIADVDRIRDLRHWLGENISIRLDANGELELESAREMLEQCADCDIESLEEPLNKSASDLILQLAQLHNSTGVALVADESICTQADLSRFEGCDAYQVVNVRVGKCGGICGTAGMLRAARQAGFAVVAGTMVGETAVMLRGSRMMLAHSDDLDYVEGIDQSKKLLQAQALVEVADDSTRHFEWVPEVTAEFVVGRKTAK